MITKSIDGFGIDLEKSSLKYVQSGLDEYIEELHLRLFYPNTFTKIIIRTRPDGKDVFWKVVSNEIVIYFRGSSLTYQSPHSAEDVIIDKLSSHKFNVNDKNGLIVRFFHKQESSAAPKTVGGSVVVGI